MNKWIEHVKQYSIDHGVQYNKALRDAKTSYKETTKTEPVSKFEYLKRQQFVKQFDTATTDRLFESYPTILKELTKSIYNLVKKNKPLIVISLVHHFKKFMDDLFVYHGSGVEALTIILKGIERIIKTIAPNNYPTHLQEGDTIKLLRFFKPKNKKTVYGLVGQTFREYE